MNTNARLRNIKKSTTDHSFTCSTLPPNLEQSELRRALRLPDVLHMTGLSRSTWYALLNPRSPSYDPAAPQPFKLGTSTRALSAWWAYDVLNWLDGRAKSSRKH